MASQDPSPHPVPDAKRIGWWAKTTDLHVASVRIRGELVMRALRDGGVAADWFDPQRADRYDCLVLSKRYDDRTLDVARRFKAGGGRVVVDLCDNHFVAASQAEHHLRQTNTLRALIAIADAITVPSPALAQIAVAECPEAVPPTIIEDLADDLRVVPLPWHRRPGVAWKRWRERQRLERLPAATLRLAWFGNARGRRDQSGLVDLASAGAELETLSRELPLHLTVISNSRAAYRDLIRPFAFSQRYVEWDPWTFDALLSAHHVALLPITPNEFTACKSSNRPVSAFLAGLAVAAGPVPSYAAMADAIGSTDRLSAGLRAWANDPGQRRADAARGRELALQSSDPGRLARQWEEACHGHPPQG